MYDCIVVTCIKFGTHHGISGRFHTYTSWCALDDVFELKVVSSVRFGWCERTNRTRVRTNLSEARSLKIGGLGSLATAPNADVWCAPAGVNESGLGPRPETHPFNFWSGEYINERLSATHKNR